MSDPEKSSQIVANISDSNEFYAIEEGMVKDVQEDNNVFAKTDEGPDFRGLSCFGATILIVKTQIGLGVLGIPFTFQSLGFFPGVLSLVILCALTTWTGIVVGQFRLNHPQVYSIGDAAHLLFGPAGREIMGVGAWLLWILFYGAGLITLSIAFNTFSNHALCTMAFVGIGAAISFVIALLARTMKALSWCGYVAVVSVLTGVWIVAIACLTQSVPAAAPEGEPIHKNIVAFAKGTSFATIGAAVSTQVFSLCGTPTLFTIHAEMRDQTKYYRALYMGQAIVSLNYIAIGCIMYGKVGDYVASPALGSAGPYIKKIAYGVSLPALLFACFFQAHVAGKYALVRILRNTKHLQSNSMVHWMTWIAVMAVVIVLGLIIAGAIPFFSDLLGLTGALLGTSFTLIIPGMMALYELADPDLQPEDSRLAWIKKSKRNWLSSRKNMIIAAVSWIAIIGGIYITVSGTYGSIVSIIDGYKSGTVGTAFSCADNSA
ncbi:hypothetical protein TRVA0_029S00254 [Trichomonascus vanleenenianus]|uniref:uncharacterized protein n=1 Tax=Trichomonascus vanleenenianus TaxID=2268995 RepID=UPI003ECAE481